MERQFWVGRRESLQLRTPPACDHDCPAVASEGDRRRGYDSTAASGYHRCFAIPRPLYAPTTRNDVSMQIAILGTGAVGPALGRAFSDAGHDVVIGTRDPQQTKRREQWASVDLPIAAYEDLDAEVFINATNARGSLPALQAVGEALNGKVVIDAANPLDSSQGFPPSLFVSNTDSLAEQLQRELPEARIVKMFNTVNNQVMINPSGLDSDTTIFVAGNDSAARQTASSLAADLGWTDVFDLGDLTAARGLEMYLPLWIRIRSQLGRANFNIKLIR
jgi:8-hydroxy-5-deazaflavin:NADPH oxidoreductase